MLNSVANLIKTVVLAYLPKESGTRAAVLQPPGLKHKSADKEGLRRKRPTLTTGSEDAP
jgi:hypothetical protein